MDPEVQRIRRFKVAGIHKIQFDALITVSSNECFNI